MFLYYHRGTKVEQQWCEQRSDSDSSQDHEPSPTPSPPPLPEPGEPVPQEIFMRSASFINWCCNKFIVVKMHFIIVIFKV